MLPRYKPSGNWGVQTTIWYVVLTVILCGAAYAYQYGIETFPHGKVRGMLLLIFAGAAGLAGYATARMGNCRSPSFAVLAACLGGAAALLYSHYLAYEHFVAARNMPSGSMSIHDYVNERARTGMQIGRRAGSRLRGVWVYIAWGVEAAAVLIAAAWAGRDCATTPFCEKCGKWADEVKRSARFPKPEDEAYRRIKKPDDVLDLLNIQPGVTAGLKQRVNYFLRGCPSCDSLPTLHVELETVKTRGKKDKSETSTLHPCVPLTSEEAEVVEALADEAEQIESVSSTESEKGS